MKATEKEKPIDTIPKGVWESSTIDKKNHISQKEHLNAISTDIQGNGYPIKEVVGKKEENS